MTNKNNMKRLVCMTTYDDIKSLRKIGAVIGVLLIVCILTFFCAVNASANVVPPNDISGNLGPLEFNISAGEEGQTFSSTLQILFSLTIITLAPSILIMVTSFTRIIIVLHFLRSALGTQTTPPNQVLIGLALFLTFFIMSPTFTQINNEAIQPFSKGEINQEQAIDIGIKPLREFMLGQTNVRDIKLFLKIAEIDQLDTVDEIPITVVIPSFIISELRKAFIIGFLLYLPFIIIDMVVSSTLMSMGMMMLPPTMIAMPFKILLFIMADGWNLIIGELVKTFY
ncbi:MAG TPA: flagellar type III secretion system pore protein FliP [Clostridiales bacterium]|nr:flagellar type III secretion system pore protein FliP [Clostridiales bacterium]